MELRFKILVDLNLYRPKIWYFLILPVSFMKIWIEKKIEKKKGQFCELICYSLRCTVCHLCKLSCKLEVKCEFREFQICTFVIFCSVLRRNWKKVLKSLEKSQRCRSQNSKVSDIHVVLVYLSKEKGKKP